MISDVFVESVVGWAWTSLLVAWALVVLLGLSGAFALLAAAYRHVFGHRC